MEAIVGTKFTNQWQIDKGIDKVNTIVSVTATRVIYSDGTTSYRGATNRKQSTWWMSVKGFEKKVKDGDIVILA